MDNVTLIAALIAALASLWSTYASYNSARTVQESQHEFEERQESRAHRRQTYEAFLGPAETLVDKLQQYVNPAEITRYELALELITFAREQGVDDGVEVSNPIPELDERGAASQRLRQLSESLRTQRVMVEIVGPPAVAAAALGYERALRQTTGAVLSRETSEAFEGFSDALGHREAFVKEVSDVLNASRD